MVSRPEELAIEMITCERDTALERVNDALKLIYDIHHHHFACTDVLAKLAAARDAITEIDLGGSDGN